MPPQEANAGPATAAPDPMDDALAQLLDDVGRIADSLGVIAELAIVGRPAITRRIEALLDEDEARALLTLRTLRDGAALTSREEVMIPVAVATLLLRAVERRGGAHDERGRAPTDGGHCRRARPAPRGTRRGRAPAGERRGSPAGAVPRGRSRARLARRPRGHGVRCGHTGSGGAGARGCSL
jgi:hypothetical protein